MTTKAATEYLFKNEDVDKGGRNVPSVGPFGSTHESLAVEVDELESTLTIDGDKFSSSE